jgi:uncharacterized damage-inducible protein DinB
MNTLDQLRYPIGKFIYPETFDIDKTKSEIQTIKTFPSQLKAKVTMLSESQLDTPYRPEGWTIRQVVHHCADSHMNSIVRLKLMLTENNPVIKPYKENLWAELPDSKNYPIQASLNLLDGLHERWSQVLDNLSEDDYYRTYRHPEYNKEVTVYQYIALYAWHCKHHLAHIDQGG